VKNLHCELFFEMMLTKRNLQLMASRINCTSKTVKNLQCSSKWC